MLPTYATFGRSMATLIAFHPAITPGHSGGLPTDPAVATPAPTMTGSDATPAPPVGLASPVCVVIPEITNLVREFHRVSLDPGGAAPGMLATLISANIVPFSGPLTCASNSG